MKLKNKYFIVRHGESPVNVKGLVSCWPEKIYSPLTRKGIKQVKEAAQKLKNNLPRRKTGKIDLIFSSDILRTKLTAEIIAKELGLKIKFDKRLRDVDLGKFNGRHINEVGKFWAIEGKKLSPLEYYKRRFTITPPRGENYVDIEKRMMSFIKEMEKKYQKKNILIVGHKRPFTLLEKMIEKMSLKKFVGMISQNKEMANGESRELKTK